MPDDWNQDDAWAEPSADEGDWAKDVRSGNAHYMQGHSVSPPQSGLGIASLVLSAISGIIIAVTVVMSAVLVAQNPNIPETDPQLIGVGCGMFAGLGLAVLAGVLGVIGLFQSDRAKVCAVLGVAFAAIQVVGLIGLMVIGLTMA